MSELSSFFVNKDLPEQVGYSSLFEKDYMAFPNRINRDIHGNITNSISNNSHTFQITTGTETTHQDKWHAHQVTSIEQVIYHSSNPNRIITKIEYEGWRRYVEKRRPTEGGRIILHVKNLRQQSALARIIDDNSFREIGWMEPIVATTDDPILGVNFREEAIENSEGYIDDLFARIRQVEPVPNEIVNDIKNVIALNSIDRFKKLMIECGFSEYEYEEAMKHIRPTALKAVASPFYVAALFCRDHKKFKEARKLLKKISKSHWQFDEARTLERSLYEHEIRENKQKYEYVIHELKQEVTHLKSRGSIANVNPVEATNAIKPTEEHQTQDQAVTERAVENAAITTQQINQKILSTITENTLRSELIPYFQGLQGLQSRQQTPDPKPAVKSEKSKRQKA